MYKNIYYYLYHSLNFIIYYIHIYVFSFLRSMRCSICWIEQQSPLAPPFVFFNTRTCFCHGSISCCFFPSCFLSFFFLFFFSLENLFFFLEEEKIPARLLLLIENIVFLFSSSSSSFFVFFSLSSKRKRYTYVFCITIYHTAVFQFLALSASHDK